MLPTIRADATHSFRKRAPSNPSGNWDVRDGLMAARMLDKERLGHLLQQSAQGMKCLGAEVDPKPEMEPQIKARSSRDWSRAPAGR